MQALRPILATALAVAAGFTIHVLYGRGWAAAYAQAVEQAGRLAHVLNEPYPRWVVAIAAITALLPTFGKVSIYLLVRDRLPGDSSWLKGVEFQWVVTVHAWCRSTPTDYGYAGWGAG